MDTKINWRKEKWKIVPGCSGYKMSNLGRVFSLKSNQCLAPKKTSSSHPNGFAYYLYDDDGKGKCQVASKWFTLTWPDLTPIDFSPEYKAVIVKKNGGNPNEARYSKISRTCRSKYSRKCNTCGKPTNNFRCDRCWAKRKREEDDLF